jgi:hypothetical protein
LRAGNTWVRSETILELDLRRQVRESQEPTDLNPKKRRPIIRLTRNLAAWRAIWIEAAERTHPRARSGGRPLQYRGEPIASVTKAIELANARWMFSKTGYSPERIAALTGRDSARIATPK